MLSPGETPTPYHTLVHSPYTIPHHGLVRQVFIKCLLCARPCAGPWGQSQDQSSVLFTYWKPLSSVEKPVND